MSRTLSVLAVFALTGCIEAAPADEVADPNFDEVFEGLPVPVAEHADIDRGMSWRLNWRYEEQGAVDVGCASGEGACDAYVGDMPCDVALPLLCFHPIEAALPEGVDDSQYHRWSGGYVRLSKAVSPHDDGIATVADADAVCAEAFGPGWRIAEFHDGWGWNFGALGTLEGIEPVTDRFWVHIDDQPDGVCWAL